MFHCVNRTVLLQEITPFYRQLVALCTWFQCELKSHFKAVFPKLARMVKWQVPSVTGYWLIPPDVFGKLALQ